jgi:uncharacterized membrane protein YfcA
MDIFLITASLGLFVGLVLAFTGAGGSILAIPLLALFLDMSMTEAAPIALFAVFLTSIVATIHGLYTKIVRYRAAMMIGVFGILFAPVGVWLTQYLSNQLLSIFFASVLIYVATNMWLQTIEATQISLSKPLPACAVNPTTSKLFWTAPCTKRLVATGSAAGFLAGLLGVGGGFVIVPTLTKVTNLEMKSIVATSLAVTALVSSVSLIVYSKQYVVNVEVAITFAITTLIGMLASKTFSHRVSNKNIQRGFAIFAYLMAIAMMVSVGIP